MSGNNINRTDYCNIRTNGVKEGEWKNGMLQLTEYK